ncbi:MAG: hypothetical protein AB1715_02005 [Acidobacteriota bacterium]
MAARFVRGLPKSFWTPLGLAEAEHILRKRFERRESDFLTLVRRAVFDNPKSPYRLLMRFAGCEFEDLSKLVSQQGIEGALGVLFREGVYLSLEEYKGRQPILRGNLTFQASTHQFFNPLSSPHLRVQSSGSSGRSVPVFIDLRFARERAVNHLLTLQGRQGMGWTHAVWGIPGSTDIMRVFELTALGRPPVRWFFQVHPNSPGLHPRYRWSVRFMRWLAALSNVIIPRPEYVPLNNPLPIVLWLRSVLDEGKIPHLVTWVTPALNICQTALMTGVDISGAAFSVGGEPLTASRLAAIRNCGCAVALRFMSVECGYIAYGCLNPEAADESHIFHDMQALVQPGKERGNSGLPANALLISSLRPLAPVVLMNVSLGDQAEILYRECGCALQKLGWMRHLRTIRSLKRITCGGMTFLDADIVEVLEKKLPACFGGNPFDYQLIEEDRDDGQPVLKLIVSPRVGPLEENALLRSFLDALGSDSEAQRVMSDQWRHSGLISVERRFPAATAAGKILPVLRLMR